MPGVQRLLVILVVGLTRRLLGSGDAPRLAGLAQDGFVADVDPVLPAVTCTVQATYLTGRLPREHGIVANGWYWRDRAEVNFWRQSNALVQAEKLWHVARRRDPGFACAQLFWWFNMFAEVEWSVTPRPAYLHDGRKVPDVYSDPPELRARLNERLGRFPLFEFWGPATSIASTRWIVDATLDVLTTERPRLTLTYLPHLDYDHQRYGPDDPRSRQALREVDREAGRLIDAARAEGVEVIVLSEYGIEEVHAPVHLNRVLREAGYLRVWRNLDRWELLEPGACRAFAVADHQLAHVYVRDPADVAGVRRLLERTDGVERVYGPGELSEIGLDHPRSGELVVLAAPGRWFSYYYWLDDDLAPDFARCVEIHKKPGYDPVELFFDPSKPLPKLRAAGKLLRKLLGFRTIMDLIPLDASLVKGSHGRPPRAPEDGAVLVGSSREAARDRLAATEVQQLLLARLAAG